MRRFDLTNRDCYRKKGLFLRKANPLMMRTGLRMLDCHSADAVMIGDRMDTDMISGLESGMSDGSCSVRGDDKRRSC